MNSWTRRQFVARTSNIVLGGAAGWGLAACHPQPAATCGDAQDDKGTTELRKSLGYTQTSVNAAQTCNGCTYFQGAADSACGTCTILSGGQVSPAGYCSSWTAKAA